eukprot:scaffold16242_cov55-Attheya_sp.AAC.2
MGPHVCVNATSLVLVCFSILAGVASIVVTSFSSTPLSTSSRAVFYRNDVLNKPRNILAPVAMWSPANIFSSSTDSKRDSSATSREGKPERDSGVTPNTILSKVPMVRRLRDRIWVRETLEDLTAAEFACSLDSASKMTNGQRDQSSDNKPKQRAVDFENLLSKLDRRVEEICVISKKKDSAKMGISCYVLNDDTEEQACYMLQEGQGMGSVVYTHAQRETLLLRIIATRQNLIRVMELNNDGEASPYSRTQLMKDGADVLDDIRAQLQRNQDGADKESTSKEKTISMAVGGKNTVEDLKVYIRDDGTVDWEGALEDKAALQKFGLSVWARINGQDPETVDEDTIDKNPTQGHEPKKAITAKIVDTEEIKDKRERLKTLKSTLNDMEKEHTALLNSAINAGQPVANIRMATLDPSLRSKIRKSTNGLEKIKEEISLQLLDYELERIYTYLDGELGNTATLGYIPLQDRLNVAEFGLLESQIGAFSVQLNSEEDVDADVLAVVLDSLTDFKRRLGIDYYVTGLTYDREAIQRWSSDLLQEGKSALAFYVKGCQLFWSDLVFCWSLILRALQGYTLKPREVRTLR